MLDHRESVLDSSHTTHLSVRYKKSKNVAHLSVRYFVYHTAHLFSLKHSNISSCTV